MVVKSLRNFPNSRNIFVNNETQYAFDGGNLIYKMGIGKNKLLSNKLLCSVLLMLRKILERML